MIGIQTKLVNCRFKFTAVTTNVFSRGETLKQMRAATYGRDPHPFSRLPGNPAAD